MATIYDVAKRARVSTYTVSCVVNQSAFVSPALTARVRAAVEALNYRSNPLARGLQTKQTQLIGVLLDDIRAPETAQIFTGIEAGLRKKGYAPVLELAGRDRPKKQARLDDLINRRVDGLIVQAPRQGAPTDPAASAAPAAQISIPHVWLGRRPEEQRGDEVYYSQVAAARKAIEALIEAGHHEIAWISGTPNPERHQHHEAGIQLAHAALPSDRLQIFPRVVGNNYKAGFAAAWELFQDKAVRPRALFGSGSRAMLGVLRALQELRRLGPAGVSVVSASPVDCSGLEANTRLFAFEEPGLGIGAKAAELLLLRLNRPRRHLKSEEVQPQLQSFG